MKNLMISLFLISMNLSIPRIIYGLSLDLFSLRVMGRKGACSSSADLKVWVILQAFVLTSVS